MKRSILFFVLTVLTFFFTSGDMFADSTGKGKVVIPGMVVVKASSSEVPPDWAVMQRQLIKSMEDAVPYYLNRFTRRDGTLYGSGPWDDVTEMFYNWSLFYGIGADEKLLNTAIMEYNALLRQCTNQDTFTF